MNRHEASNILRRFIRVAPSSIPSANMEGRMPCGAMPRSSAPRGRKWDGMGMTWADHDIDFEHALAELSERFPGERIEILEAFDIAHIGWECDYQGALITHDGVPELVIVDATISNAKPVLQQLEQRVEEYRRLIAETERVLERYRRMYADYVLQRLRDEFATEPPQPGDELPDVFDRLIATGVEDTEIPEEYRLESDDEPPPEAGYEDARIDVLSDMNPRTRPDEHFVPEIEYELQRSPGETDDEWEERKQLFDDHKQPDGSIVLRVEQLPDSVIERLQETADEYPDEELDLHGGMLAELAEKNLQRLIGDRQDVVIMDGGPVTPPDTLIDAQERVDRYMIDPKVRVIIMYIVERREIGLYRKGITSASIERYGPADEEIHVIDGVVIKTVDIWEYQNGAEKHE